MRPDWNKAPDWALFVAQEASGSWYWYAERPIYSELCTEWQAKGQRQIIPRVDLRPQETLEIRPGLTWIGGHLINEHGRSYAQQE